MAWVWEWPDLDFNAWFDYSGESVGIEFLSDKPIAAGSVPALYKSNTRLKRFAKLHCPPMGTHMIVDQVWQDIILKFVPEERIQFYPVILDARGEFDDRFRCAIPFDRAECIDVHNSTFTSIAKDGDKTDYFGVHHVTHLPDCLGRLHLARDTNVVTHVVVSDELRDALAATGEHSMFYRPEDLPLVGKHLPYTIVEV